MLPGSRNRTYSVGDPVDPELLNQLQDVVIDHETAINRRSEFIGPEGIWRSVSGSPSLDLEGTVNTSNGGDIVALPVLGLRLGDTFAMVELEVDGSAGDTVTVELFRKSGTLAQVSLGSATSAGAGVQLLAVLPDEMVPPRTRYRLVVTNDGVGATATMSVTGYVVSTG